jgi:3-deoxy-D-manno-octulosonic-acid transferase
MTVLKGLEKIFVADQISLEVLNDKELNNAELAGDTRIDRVIETSSSHRDFSFLLTVLQSEEILVAGSTWPRDEALLTPLLNSRSIKGVIAPHEVNESHVEAIESALTVSHVRLSDLQEHSRADVVIVDTIGDLAHIYHIASIAYVGGGFGKGIHNILEAAVYRTPVIFGPNYRQFAEAVELIELGAASSISSKEMLENSFLAMSKASFRNEIRDTLADYFERHEGATARIYDYICRENLLQDGLED